MTTTLVPDWIKDYRSSWLTADLLAGLTVAALVVPEGMAYAQLAGVPPEAAFYAALLALSCTRSSVRPGSWWWP